MLAARQGGQALEAARAEEGAGEGAGEVAGEGAGEVAREVARAGSGSAAPTQGPRSEQESAGVCVGAGEASEVDSPWLMPLEHLADELVTFFVRGVFTEDAR